MSFNDNVVQVGDSAFLADVSAAVFEAEPSNDIMKDPDELETIGEYKIVPWGANNNLPAEILEKIGKAEVVESNLLFNICVGYGQGLKPKLKVVKDGKINYHELDPEDKAHQKVLAFFERNDIDGWFLEQLTDMHALYNVFPEIIVDKGKKKINTLRHKEATFSRWGTIEDKETRITKHYYSAEWDDSPDEKDIEETKVLDRFDPLSSLETYLKTDKEGTLRYIYPVHFPTPGRTYYQTPYWWAIFKSGWYDFLTMIPGVKKALLKNQLGIRYIVYVHPDYWGKVMQEEGVDVSDTNAVKSFKTKEYKNIQNFIAGEENAGKGLITSSNYRVVANGVVEEKYLKIEQISSPIKDGELISDSEEASNIISYAMQIHPSLIGSTPGKSKGSFSGTDKRELFLIKVAMMAPYINRIKRPLTLIKQFNKWPKNLVFVNEQIEFTTLDENKSGQKTTETE